MIFTLGIGALGAARVLVRRPGGYSLLAVGTLLGSVVRPHVVLLELVAFGARVPHRASTGSRSGRHAELGRQGRGSGGAARARRGTRATLRRRSSGRPTSPMSTPCSRSTRPAPTKAVRRSRPSIPPNPVGYVEAAVTVLFRPFPNETGGLEQTAAALEAVCRCCVLFITSWRRLVTIPGRLRTEPYVTFALYLRADVHLRVRHDRELRHPRPPAIAGDAVRVRVAVGDGSRRRPDRSTRSKRRAVTGAESPRDASRSGPREVDQFHDQLVDLTRHRVVVGERVGRWGRRRRRRVTGRAGRSGVDPTFTRSSHSASDSPDRAWTDLGPAPHELLERERPAPRALVEHHDLADVSAAPCRR